ncbi:MAG: sigma-54-dependent Fis family transcriptional regulator [Pirellulales bacterium]|nr:sigma-54-dependent Fis family transcriptional regulator [Pirellulales bacterium]
MPMDHYIRLGFPTEEEPTDRPGLTGAIPSRTSSNGRSDSSGSTILIASEESSARQTLRRLLESANYRVVEAQTGRELLDAVSDQISVVISNVSLPEISGRDCLRHLKNHHPDMPVIMISRMGEVPDALAVMKEGAFECFTRSCHPEHLLAQVHQAVRLSRLARENRMLLQTGRTPTGDVTLAGESATTHTLRQQAETFARLDSNVLITGPAGTGKTTVARWIHRHSERSAQPLVIVHCATIPRDLIEAELFGYAQDDVTQHEHVRPGRIEMAKGGTLILEEVGQLPPDIQARLNETLQNRTVRRIGTDHTTPVDVRVIATATEDPAQLTRQGFFREDLLFRLNVLSMRLPPLREHLDDVPAIAAAMLLRIARRAGGAPLTLASEAVETLSRHPWPGNTAELESVLEHAASVCRGSTILRKNLTRLAARPAEDGAARTGVLGLAGLTLAEIERCAILETMQACGGNKAQTARELGVSEKTIYNKIKQYDLRGVIRRPGAKHGNNSVEQ